MHTTGTRGTVATTARTRTTKERRGALIVALGRRVEKVVAKSLDGRLEGRQGYLNPEGKPAIARIWWETGGHAALGFPRESIGQL